MKFRLVIWVMIAIGVCGGWTSCKNARLSKEKLMQYIEKSDAYTK